MGAGRGSGTAGTEGGTGRREGRELRGPHGCAVTGDPPAAGPARAPKLWALGCRLGRGGEGSAVPRQLRGWIPGLRAGKGRMCLAVSLGPVLGVLVCGGCGISSSSRPLHAEANTHPSARSIGGRAWIQPQLQACARRTVSSSGKSSG